MLTLTLRGLERDGIVTRTVYPTTPPRVQYELTSRGHLLRKPVEALGDWAFTHLDAIDRSREEFDRQIGTDPAQSAQRASGQLSETPIEGMPAQAGTSPSIVVLNNLRR